MASTKALAADAAAVGTLGDALIPIINKLQDIFSQVTVDLKLALPQVAVVGSQSSGKSSVLEALVGRDFLPRGSDIVTRRPLVLQLVKTQPGTGPGLTAAGPAGAGVSEWGEFLHSPGKVYTDFEQIRQEIQAETDRVVGTNKGVSDKPIRLKIYSPHVLTMTLVDLPGMTKVPVGDQPSNIEARIREMVLGAISPPSVIILAVSPANADLANSDGIQIARMVDPEGLRTIGVLTKLDIMDRGTNASHILRGAHIPLRLGYVAVVNRSQEDINKSTSIDNARRAEERFFASRPEYRDVLAQCSVTNLARRLNVILAEHIRALLPALRRGIADSLEARLAELRALGDPLPLSGDGKSARGAFLLQLLCEYAERFASMLEGRNQDLSAQRLTGGARIRHVFNEVFGRAMREASPVKDVSDDAILTVIKNGTGVAGNLLVPQEPFELLVRRSIGALLSPSLACKELVYEELLNIAEQTCPKEATRFPGLQRQLAHAVLGFIRSGAEPADKMIRSLLECEHDFINCDHPDFIGGRGAIRAVMQERSVRAANRAKENGDVGGTKDAAASTAASAPAVASSGASGARAKPATTGLALDKGGSAPGAVQLGATPGLSMGLKALPEGSSHTTDELLSRTRRRSDNGYGGLHHSATSDDVMHLGAGGGAGFSPGPGHAHGGSASAAPASSWFSWFSKPSQTQGTMDDSMVGGLAGIRGRAAQANGMAGNGGGASPRTEQEEIEVEVIRRLVDSYFAIVKRNLADGVPKAIMHFMVNSTKRGLQQHLIQQLYKEGLLEELLSEKEDIVQHRRGANEAVNALQSAMKALEELPGELGLATGGASSSSSSLMASSLTLSGSPNQGMFAAAGISSTASVATSSSANGGTASGSANALSNLSLGYGSGTSPYSPLAGAGAGGGGDGGFGGAGGPGGQFGQFGQQHGGLDRHPSMVAAARVAAVATASLTGMGEAAMA